MSKITRSNVKATQVGSTVSQEIFTAEAIRDTNTHDSSQIDLSSFSDYYFVIYSTLDENIIFSYLRVNGYGVGARFPVFYIWNPSTKTYSEDATAHNKITINSAINQRPHIWVPGEMPTFGKTIILRLQASVAPTAGSITIELLAKEAGL